MKIRQIPPGKRCSGKLALQVFDLLNHNGQMYPTFARWFAMGCPSVEHGGMEVVYFQPHKHATFGACFYVPPGSRVVPRAHVNYNVMIYVHQDERRRKGIGRALLQAVDRRVQECRNESSIFRIWHGTEAAALFYRAMRYLP